MFSRRTCAENSSFARVEALITATESLHLFSSLFLWFVTFRSAARRFQFLKSDTIHFNSTFQQLRVQFHFYLFLYAIVVSPDGENKTDPGRFPAARRCAKTRGVKCLLSQGFYTVQLPPPEKPVGPSCTLKGKPTKIYRLIYGVQLGAATAEEKHRTFKSTVDTVKRHLWPSYSYHSQHGKTFIAFNPTFHF